VRWQSGQLLPTRSRHHRHRPARSSSRPGLVQSPQAPRSLPMPRALPCRRDHLDLPSSGKHNPYCVSAAMPLGQPACRSRAMTAGPGSGMAGVGRGNDGGLPAGFGPAGGVRRAWGWWSRGAVGAGGSEVHLRPEDTCAWLSARTALSVLAVLLRLSWRSWSASWADRAARTDQLEGLGRIGIDEISYRIPQWSCSKSNSRGHELLGGWMDRLARHCGIAEFEKLCRAIEHYRPPDQQHPRPHPSVDLRRQRPPVAPSGG